MARLLKQSQTAEPLVFLMVDSTDHLSAKTGLTCTVTLSKNGGAFGAPSGAVSEIANGWYKVAGNATDENTLGPLVLHATATGADPSDVVFQVVGYDPEAAGVVVTTNNDKTGYTASTVSDKTGYSLATNDSPIIQTNTASAGGASTITLVGSSATDHLYEGESIKIVSGTGAGQVRTITGYVGSTKVATVDRAWNTNPDNTSVYVVMATSTPKLDSSLQVTAASVQGNVTGSVGSVTGAVGSVTGAVGSLTTNNDKTGYSLAADQAVNVTKVNGTTQTARDLGASVLISPGTGAGQLDVTSGVIKANLVQILATALTETAGQIAAAFKQFFNIASPTSTMNTITTVTTTTTASALTTNNDKTGYSLAAAQHVIADSLTTNNDKSGYSLAALDSMVLQSGTASAGGASTITLAGASATDHIYEGELVKVYGGTGAGQTRVITGYVGSTKVATVDRAWTTQPDNTSLFAVLASDEPKVDSSLQVTAASVQGNVTGSVGSVTGAVGSVTGAVGSVTAGVIVTTNNDKTGYALTGGEHTAIAGDVLNATAASYNSAGTIGHDINAAGTASDPWTTALPGGYGAGTAGKIIGSNLDAAITSRLASGNVTVGTNNDKTGYALTAGEHTNIAADVLDATASSHNTAGTIGNKINSAASAGDPWSTALPGAYGAGSAGYILGTNLDALVSSRLAALGYTAPPSAASITGAVWNEAIAGHLGAGSTGAKLNGAAAAGDPLGISVPGSYGAGTAGYDIAYTASRLASLGAANITIVGPVDSAGNIGIRQGNSYTDATKDWGPLVWTESIGAWQKYIGKTAVFVATLGGAGVSPFSKSVAITDVNGTAANITLVLTSAETAAFVQGSWTFEVQVTFSAGIVVVPLRGVMIVAGE